MKKFLKLTLAVSLSALLCAQSVSAMRVGNVSYTDSNGSGVAAVRNGVTDASVTVNNTAASALEAQLISAVYDDMTGELLSATYSDVATVEAGGSAVLTAQLSLATTDGYTVKNYVWDSLSGSLKPYGAPQGGIITAKAEWRATGEAVVTWIQITESDHAGYMIIKNGSVLKDSLSADASVYIDTDAADGDEYIVAAVNEAGDIIASSKAAAVAATTPEKPELVYSDSESIYTYVAADNVDAEGTSASDYSYSSNQTQIGVQRNSTLLDAATKKAIATYDSCWTIVEVGPEGDKRKALYSTTYTNSADASKNGNIPVGLGSDYTTEDAYQTVTVTYYDHLSSGSFRIRYITSDSNTYKSITYTGTNKWLTKTVTLDGAYFNSSSTALSAGADFRFESNGNDLYISKFSVNNGTVAAEFPNRYSKFTVDGSTLLETSSSGWSVRSSGTGVEAEGQETLVDDGDGTYSTASGQDTTYMYVESIDGKSALMAAPYTRPNGNESKGFIAFRLDQYNFLPEDNGVVIDVVYNSNYGVPIINYMNSFDSETSAFTGTTLSASEIIGTDTWKTARFVFEDIVLNQFATGDCNLFGGTTEASFRVRADSTVYINSVTVMKKTYFDNVVSAYDSAMQEYEELTTDLTPDADTLYPDGISISFSGSTPVENGLVFNDSVSSDTAEKDCNFKYTEDGEAVMTQSYLGGNYTDSRKRLTYLYFDIDKAYLRGIYDSYAEITLEYLDESEYTMQLQYYNSSDTVVTKNYTLTGSGQWKKHTFVVNDIYCMNDLFGGGYDIRLDLACAQPTDENPDPVQLKVKSVTVKNLSHKKQDTSRYSAEPKVYIASDSIAAAYTDGSRPYGERYGWGEKLNPGVTVVNYAKAGASTKTFESFDTIADSLNKNDYVLICFGHNDSMSNKYVSPEDYKANLKAFAQKILDAQAIPVIMSPIPTLYEGETDLAPTGGINNYRNAALEVSAEINVPSFDLASAFGNVLENCSTTEEKEAYYVPDSETSTRFVHLSRQGAQCIADLIVDGLKNNDKIRVLKNYIPVN